MTATIKYKQPDLIIGFTALAAVLLSYLLLWKNHAAAPVNFIVGDTEYYYYYLQSTFIDHSLINFGWLKPGSGSFITHHPVGISLLLSPFFLVAFFAAHAFHYPVDGLSLPFQMAISAAAIVYCIIGLVYLKKLLHLNGISDKIIALTLALIFFGTTLYHYTLIESAMSHVYSFCFMTVFLYHSCKFVLFQSNRNLLSAAAAFGIILLIRANNVFILFSLLFWFRNKEQAVNFFKQLIKNKTFYYSLLIVAACVAFQLITWAIKENNLYTNRYAPYGFSWLHPHFIKMLFGFDSGFFIYTPLCFLFLFGLAAIYKEHKFMFYTLSVFLLGLLYFFSSYSAYTYFDGLGIRVLVDYYAIFALLGAKLFTQLAATKFLYSLSLALALFFVLVNVVYSYQSSRGILMRSGMTFNQWKYVFLRTGASYQQCLGGSHDLTPFSKEPQKQALSSGTLVNQSFDFSEKEFGVDVRFDSIGFNSNRAQIKIDCDRKESFTNASKEALICIALQDKVTGQNKSYTQFKLNETPATNCCDDQHYEYTSTLSADLKANDRLVVYLWNLEKQSFSVSNFSVTVYNYNYQIK